MGQLSLVALSGLPSCLTFSDIAPTARPEPKAVKLAVVAYQDDIGALDRAGGRSLGRVWSSGNGFASKSRVRDEARDRAAEYGCTHAIYIDMGTTTELVTVKNAQCTTEVSSYGYRSHATTSCSGPTRFPVSRWRGTWLCVRVEPEQWCELPEPLRPPESGEACLAIDELERNHGR